MAAIDQPDITLPEVVRPREDASAAQLRLTILYHPELSRIGQVSDFSLDNSDSVLELGRLDPPFRDLRTELSSVLDDPYISRTPLQLSSSAEGICLDVAIGGSSLSVDGTVVAESVCVSFQQLERGAVLVLARRIVLLLKVAASLHSLPEEYGLIGESDGLQRLRSAIGVAAQCDLPVLVIGETGTGKELVAQAVHGHSARSSGQLVTMNMAAIPVELAATELFGVCRGAFTGADEDRQGCFSRADGSSLFLDEAGDCPAQIQPLLLRVLESGEIQVPGGTSSIVDVRIITATDADLNDGGRKFSAALKHRLGGIEIRIPPLRDRLEDIGRLLQRFLVLYQLDSNATFYRGDRDPVEAAQWAALVSAFALHRWPGNVRELRNYCYQLATTCHRQGVFTVPDSVHAGLACDSDEQVSAPVARSTAYRAPADIPVEEIAEALQHSRYQLAAAARRLNISRPSLYNRLEAIPGLRLAGDIPLEEITTVYDECEGRLSLAADRLAVSEPGLLRRWHALELEARPEL